FEVKTLPGGSKSGKGRGEIDTVIFAPSVQNPGSFIAHIYDLKPFHMDPAYYNQHKQQVRNYAKHFDKAQGLNAEAKVGTALEVLERLEANKPPEQRLLRPIKRDVMVAGKLYELTISLVLPRDEKGHVIDGFLAYSVSWKRKLKPEEENI